MDESPQLVGGGHIQAPELALVVSGLHNLTPDRRYVLSQMVSGLGLRLVTGEATNTIEPNETWRDLHTCARDLSSMNRVNQKIYTIALDDRWTKTERNGLDLLANGWWAGIKTQAQADPVRTTEIAQCLSASPEVEDRVLSARILRDVFRAYVLQGSLSGAHTIAELLLGMGDDPNITVKVELTETLDPLIEELRQRISQGQGELQPIVDILHGAAARAQLS